MSIRSAAFLAVVMSLAPLGLLSAQQAAPTAAPEGIPAASAAPAANEATAGVTPVPAVPQPQYSPLFQKGDPEPALGTADKSAAASGGSHKIVVSTLVLVLIVVILVLLIA